jgi:hypothetical protein
LTERAVKKNKNIFSNDIRVATAGPDQNYIRKQAIAKILKLQALNGPNHTNQFDF